MAATPAQPPNPRSETPSAPALWEWVVLVELLFLAGFLRYLWADFDLDDSFITYTFARSLAHGEGFRFGGAEVWAQINPVLGTTTPLYAFFLAGAALCGAPIITAAKVIGWVSSLAACVLLYFLLRHTLGVAAGLAGATLLIVNVRHTAISMSGMETALYTAVVLGAFLAFLHRRPSVTALLASAAILLRPDGLLLAPVLAAAHVAERRKIQVLPLLLFFLPLVAWTLYAWWEFGSPVPTSLTAKLAYPDYGPFRLDSASRVFSPELAVPMTVLCALGLLYAGLRRRVLLPVLAWGGLYLAAFVRAPNFPWYYVPPIPAMIVGSLAGMALLVELFVTRLRLGEAGENRLRFAVALGAAAAILVPTQRDWNDYRHIIQRSYGEGVTEAYRALAFWFRDHTRPEDEVAVPEVGYVGYYSGRQVLDLAGLCSPSVIPYLAARDYAGIIQEFKPEYVALTTEKNRPIHNAIAADEEFQDYYQEEASIPYRGGGEYVVYRRISQPAPLPAPPPPRHSRRARRRGAAP